MSKRTFFVCLSGLVFWLSFMSAARAADAPIAEVLTLVPGASVSRDGRTLPLERFSPLRLSDTVSTDAAGRLRILFADDSTVDLGANSSLDLRDFADSGAASVFNVHLLHGVARVITGKIVEANPQGFTVSTPEATIGIRGTILSLRAGDGTTTVYVENTTRAVYVNNINVPGGQKITIPADPIRPEPILPQDRRNLG
ncbi:MAG: FecR family protein, partial [Deltaproteobacteria bacterium]|nr:FecR family protein [Deltaproteobacteria bacterium]